MMPHATARWECDVAVVGGGLVGAAIAVGLGRIGQRVIVFDEGDIAFRASRGNFALVWIQGKGLGMPRYAEWAQQAGRDWPDLAAWLLETTGVDVCLQQPGGLVIALSDRELEDRAARIRRLQQQPGVTTFPYEVLDHAGVARLVPQVGKDVAGAVYSPLDGHVNSLRLLRALHAAMAVLGVAYRPNAAVGAIEPKGGAFRLTTAAGAIDTGKVVLAAGIGSAVLAPMVGLTVPVRPQRGNILVTERILPVLNHPLLTIRQTDEGTIMIGDSAEEAGPDTATSQGIASVLAERAIRTLPFLGALNLVRHWAALRVMTADGFPIYAESASCPGAFAVSCHSGVTLASVHAQTIAPMIAAGALAPDLAPFDVRRFDVPAVA
jgi:glycine/D-amino acid oxidase-like deaminating enzyme